MNKNQLIAMWAGIIISIIIVFSTETRFGLLSSPVVDYGPLLGRLAVTVIATVALIYTLKSKDK